MAQVAVLLLQSARLLIQFVSKLVASHPAALEPLLNSSCANDALTLVMIHNLALELT